MADARKNYVIEEEEATSVGLFDDPDDDVAVRIRAVRPPPLLTRDAHRRKRQRSMLFNLVALLVPPLLATMYFMFISSDIYEVDTVILVKTASIGGGGGASGASAALASIAGSSGGSGGAGSSSSMTRAIDESYAVVSYIESTEAFDALNKELNLRSYFAQRRIDWWNRLGPDADYYQAYNYYLNHVKVYYDDVQGQILLTTYGFDADTSYRMAKSLEAMSEQLVNEFNDRAYKDFLALARDQVGKKTIQLKDANDQLTEFRLHNAVIDPTAVSTAFSGIISALLSQEAETQADIDSMAALGFGGQPKIGPLRNRLAALEQQVKREQEHLTGESGALAPVMQKYASLQMQVTIAQQEYTSALSQLDSSLFDAQRQKLYVVNVVPPIPPAEAFLPHRMKAILLSIAATIGAWIVLRVIIAALRDHMV